MSGGGWGVGDLLGATRAALAGAGRARAVPVRAQRQAARARVARARRRAASAGDGLHRPDGRRAGRERRARALERRPDRARGDHPRLPGDLVRLRLRPRPRVERRRWCASGWRRWRRNVSDIGPALDRALEHRPEPDGSFARRPSTASLILDDERRADAAAAPGGVRTARAVADGRRGDRDRCSWTLTTGASYSLVSHFVHMRPVTDGRRPTAPEVGVLVDAPASEIPTIANYLSEHGIRASFTMSQAADPQEPIVVAYGDQAVPRLPDGGLVRWLGARDQLHDLMAAARLRPPLPVRVERAQRRAVVDGARSRRPARGRRGPAPGQRRQRGASARGRGRRARVHEARRS